MAVILWPDTPGLRSQRGQLREAPEGTVDAAVHPHLDPDQPGVSDRMGATTLRWVDGEILSLWLELQDLRADRAATVRLLAKHVLSDWIGDQREMTWTKRRLFAAARDWGYVTQVLSSCT